MMFKRFRVLVAVVLTILASVSTAHAQYPDDDVPSPDPEPAEPTEAEPADPGEPGAPRDKQAAAAELKAKGDTAMLDLRYDEALDFYEKAYALDPNPALLYNQGRAYQARGSFPEALSMLRRFDAEAPPELRARVPRLDELIAELERKVTNLTVVVNVAGARLVVGTRDLGTSPAPMTVVNAGDAVIKASKKGYRVLEKKVVLEGGKAQTVNLTLVPLKTTGLLQVRSVAGALVFVDGKEVGSVPTDVEVEPGEHTVVVRHDDYEEAHTTVVLDAGQTKLHQVDLVPIPPIYERWWFWSGIGAVSATAAVVVVAAFLEGPVEEGNIEPGAVAAPLVTVFAF